MIRRLLSGPSLMTAEDEAAWIQTWSGRKFWPLSPRVEDIDIEDIAHALSNMCRFSGHVRWFYPVAQHAVLTSYQVPLELAFKALNHDDSEGYLPDLPSPVKRHPLMAEYRAAEARLMVAIAKKLGISDPIEPPEVKLADRRMLATESRDLLGPRHPDWDMSFEPYPEIIVPMSPAEAKQAFLNRFHELQHAA